MLTVSKGVVVDGTVLTVEVTDEVRETIREWEVEHLDDLNQRLAEHGLNAYDFAPPAYRRVVTNRDIEGNNG